MSDIRDNIWVEKYRPKVVADCILPTRLKTIFSTYVKKGDVGNLLFSGTPGIGKTTVAKALCHEIGGEYIVINGSDEGRSIDVLRTVIKDFASTVSISDAKKVIIIDEADYMNAQSVQPALRNFIESTSSNCRFIFTCNHKNKIIPPLQSRLNKIEFRVANEDKKEILRSLFDRIKFILKNENIEYTDEAAVFYIKKYYPDYRKIISSIQLGSETGTLELDDNSSLENITTELYDLLKSKKFNSVRKWVAENSDIDMDRLFSVIFNGINMVLKNESIPQAILILAEYQYKSSFVSDHELNVMAAFTEIMSSCEFK